MLTYDDPDADVESMEKVALLEILRSTEQTSPRGFYEGLVSRRAGSEDQYNRIGYFRSEKANLFDNTLAVEIALA